MPNYIKKFKVKIKRKIQNLKIKTKLFKNLPTKPKSIIHLSARKKAYSKFGITKKQVQRQIKILYQKIALKYGFKIENDFYIKELR